MPEGNELHRLAQLQSVLFVGKRVAVAGPNGRFADGAALLNGRTLRGVEAFGKHLLYDFGPHRHLHVHLGLFGRFRDGIGAFPEPRGALRLRIATAKHWTELRGPTACEILDDSQQAVLLARIGPDPLRPDADPRIAFRRIRTSRAPIGALLMDQSVIGGIGNIFRAEILFRAAINPLRPGKETSLHALRKLWQDTQTLMQYAVDHRIIVTTNPEDRPHPAGKVRAGEKRYVYGRPGLPCFRCQREVEAQMLAGRRAFWCPGCQFV